MFDKASGLMQRTIHLMLFVFQRFFLFLFGNREHAGKRSAAVWMFVFGGSPTLK